MQQGAATRAQNRQLPDGRPATVPWQVGCSARLVACLAFLHVVGGLSSQCSQDYIAWPQEQCTLPCPEQQVRCGYDTTIPVTRYQSEYCCLCIPSDAGTYKPFLCAGSAWPQPTPAEVHYNGTISGQQTSATVDVPEGATSLTSYVDISPTFAWSEDPLSYLEISVAAIVKTSNSSFNSTSTSSSDPRRRGIVPRSADARALMSPHDTLRATAQYAVKGLNGGQALYMWSHDPVQARESEAPESSVNRELSARRDTSDGAWLEWYLQDGVPPQIDTPVPFFLYEGQNVGIIPIIQPRSAHAVTKRSYVMGLRGVGASFGATVTAVQKKALDLTDNTPMLVTMQPNERIFTHYRLPAGVDQALVVLDIQVQTIVNASVRMYVGMDFLATARRWSKWVGGTDMDLASMPDRFYTSNLMVRAQGHEYTSWTLESSRATTWVVQPRHVLPQELLPDTPKNFAIETDTGVALFMMRPGENQSRLFFQLMPSPAAASRQAYERWEDLQRACRIMAATKVNGEWAYFQLSDWGYTTDGTPGLQVMISQWDAGATIYLHVYLKTTAPNAAFTVVCYLVDDALESWKWWFGGIFFALFIFCMARCVLCRSPAGQYWLGRRLGRRDASESSGMHSAVEMQRMPQHVVATTTEPPPSKLKKVGDTLYSRSSHESVTQLLAPPGPVGPMFAGAENEGDPDDDAHTCTICMDRAPEAILLECGHGGLCMPCAESIWNQGADGRLCPMCRKAITGIVRIVSESGNDVTVEVVHYSLAPPESARPSLFRRLISRQNLADASTTGADEDAAASATPSAASLPPVTQVRNSELSNLAAVRPTTQTSSSPLPPQPSPSSEEEHR